MRGAGAMTRIVSRVVASSPDAGVCVATSCAGEGVAIAQSSAAQARAKSPRGARQAA